MTISIDADGLEDYMCAHPNTRDVIETWIGILSATEVDSIDDFLRNDFPFAMEKEDKENTITFYPGGRVVDVVVECEYLVWNSCIGLFPKLPPRGGLDYRIRDLFS